MMEIWKSVVGYEGLYEVSNMGRVKSLPRPRCQGRILKPHINKGYEYVHLCKNGKPYYAKIHRIVADAFLDAVPNKIHVNHIDGNKLNNSVENLEWCTSSENLKHARENGLNITTALNNPYTSKAIEMISSDGIIKTFPSFMEAERQTGIKRQSIYLCCMNKKGHHTAGGYAWRYAKDGDCVGN